jgi:hypothetical protein
MTCEECLVSLYSCKHELECARCRLVDGRPIEEIPTCFDMVPTVTFDLEKFQDLEVYVAEKRNRLKKLGIEFDEILDTNSTCLSEISTMITALTAFHKKLEKHTKKAIKDRKKTLGAL